MKYEITANEAFKSFEIAFDGKPSEAVRDALKSLRYRWHSVKKVWYGYSDEETVRKAIENAVNGVKVAKPSKTVKTAEKVNKYGVKVGDMFVMSWGWEQTNVDFFQVIELCGETSVRVREVSPEIIARDGITGMSEDRTYRITSEILPSRGFSVFVKDNDKGDIKRISDWGNGTPCIKFDHNFATRVACGEHKEYVSWYA